MAKKSSLDSYLGNYLFKKPEKKEDGSIMTERYKTYINLFDMFLNGGLPRGRIITIGAEEGVGKTTLLIQALGNIVENSDKKVYYMDIEGGAYYELFEAMGYAYLLYDPDDNPNGRLYLLNLTTIQEVAAVIKKVAADPNTAAIVIDSDTDVVDGNALEEEDLGTSNKAAASNARMWSKSIGLIKAIIKGSNACLIMVHQARIDLSGFMPKVVATGGRAIKHATSVEIWGKRKGWIMEDFSISKAAKDRENAIGASVLFTTYKNRLSKPFMSVSIPIFFGKGVSNKWAYKEWLEENEWIDEVTAEVIPFIQKKGSWFNLSLPNGIKKKVQGDSKVWEFVNENYEYIKEYVDTHGGFKLFKSSTKSSTPFDKN